MCSDIVQKLRQMADNSFSWASKRGLVRTNEVHGMEEAKLVLEEFFENDEEMGSKTRFTAEEAVEDCCFTRSSF